MGVRLYEVISDCIKEGWMCCIVSNLCQTEEKKHQDLRETFISSTRLSNEKGRVYIQFFFCQVILSSSVQIDKTDWNEKIPCSLFKHFYCCLYHNKLRHKAFF